MDTIIITAEDLYKCTSRIEFTPNSKKSNMISIPHPKFKKDGHSIGIMFRKKELIKGKFFWVVTSNLTIIDSYAKA